MAAHFVRVGEEPLVVNSGCYSPIIFLGAAAGVRVLLERVRSAREHLGRTVLSGAAAGARGGIKEQGG